MLGEILWLECRVIVVQALERTGCLSEYVFHGFDWRSAHQNLNDISTESAVVAQESMSFGYGVDVLVQEKDGGIF